MRLIEIIVPESQIQEVQKVIADRAIDHWSVESHNQKRIFKFLVEDDHSVPLIQDCEKYLANQRIVIYAIEGTLPRIKKTENKKEEIKLGKFTSIGKEELYEDIEGPVNLSYNFIFMVILSSVVAGIGILKNNLAVVIGAMVIAPFLGPNISMSFGTTLGDLRIIRKSIITGIISSLIAIIISIFWGLLSNDVGTIQGDSAIEYQDVILALVCGFAGVLSIISGQGSTLVGVMVAAALLPPLMRAGLFIGGGYYEEALNSFLIFSTNIVCLNIAGIVTFWASGITPSRWWEKETAAKRTKIAITVWTIALILIILAIILLQMRA